MDFMQIEKVKTKIISAIKNLFNPDTNNVNSSFATKKYVNTLDSFTKKTAEDNIFTPVSKKIWIDGKEHNVIASSQQELDQKIKNINLKNTKKSINTNFIDTTHFSFS